MNTILLLLSLLGSIALCLYGMKVMSQGILKVAGAYMRASLRGIAHHRLQSFGVGAWITGLIQSSSAMTIMTVSLVNAGLLTLGQSIAIMMGANVGTTLTAWIIAIFGYACNIGYLAIPIVVIALPFVYTTRTKRKPWGEVLMGLALFILGFTTFIATMPSPSSIPEVQASMQLISSAGFWSVLLFVVIGVAITTLFRSSAATIMLAMVAVASSWIEFPMAAGLVLGDNVGTTLTAVIASRSANVSARRAAMSHLMFNVFGLVWALPLLYPLSAGLTGLVAQIAGQASPATLAFAVAIYHTLFNLVTALVLIFLIPQFQSLLCRMLPVAEGDDEEFRLNFIQGGLLSTAELSVEEARKEAALFGARCQKMLRLTTDFIHMQSQGAEFSQAFSRIEKYEKITDRLELEIVRYLNSVDRSTVSSHIASRVRALFRIVDELESIGDSCYKMACTIVRKREHSIQFINMQNQNIDRMLDLTRQAMDMMCVLLQKTEITPAEMSRAYNHEDAINALRGQLRDQNIGSVQAGYYTYQSGALYMDVVNACEKLGDYIINVLEAQVEQNDN